jgi:hypothetical protein
MSAKPPRRRIMERMGLYDTLLFCGERIKTLPVAAETL